MAARASHKACGIGRGLGDAQRSARSAVRGARAWCACAALGGGPTPLQASGWHALRMGCAGLVTVGRPCARRAAAPPAPRAAAHTRHTPTPCPARHPRLLHSGQGLTRRARPATAAVSRLRSTMDWVAVQRASIQDADASKQNGQLVHHYMSIQAKSEFSLPSAAAVHRASITR